jgi:LAO/AO transport system kinase
MSRRAEETDPDALADRLIAGDRRALARAITLCESARPDHREAARRLLARARAAGRSALRIGLSGAPGVGKSSFIEAFGLMLTAAGERVAVLAVDPSSARSGGSILGDKTRMERLARVPGAFIRPSPAQGALGGVARRTREAIVLVEAAGHGIVIVETVGVGQSETMVADMTDLFVLLIQPAAGDDLQGVKRGIMERADLILVTKADGALAEAAARTEGEHAAALRLMRRRAADPEGFPAVLRVSAHAGTGLPEAWSAMRRLADWRDRTGARAAMRAAQAGAAFRAELAALVLARLEADPRVAALAAAVARGEREPEEAAAAAAALRPAAEP